MVVPVCTWNVFSTCSKKSSENPSLHCKFYCKSSLNMFGLRLEDIHDSFDHFKWRWFLFNYLDWYVSFFMLIWLDCQKYNILINIFVFILGPYGKFPITYHFCPFLYLWFSLKFFNFLSLFFWSLCSILFFSFIIKLCKLRISILI